MLSYDLFLLDDHEIIRHYPSTYDTQNPITKRIQIAQLDCTSLTEVEVGNKHSRTLPCVKSIMVYGRLKSDLVEEFKGCEIRLSKRYCGHRDICVFKKASEVKAEAV